MKSFSRLKKVALSAAPLAAKHSSALFDAAESLEGDAHFSFWAGAVAGRSTAAFGRTSAPEGRRRRVFRQTPACRRARRAHRSDLCLFPGRCRVFAVCCRPFRRKGRRRRPGKRRAAPLRPSDARDVARRPALRRPLRTAAALRHARCAYLRGLDPAWSDVVSVTSMDMEPGPRSRRGVFRLCRRAPVVFRRALESLFGRLHVLSVPGACFPDVGLRSPVRRTGLEVRQRFRLFPGALHPETYLNS